MTKKKKSSNSSLIADLWLGLTKPVDHTRTGPQYVDSATLQMPNASEKEVNVTSKIVADRLALTAGVDTEDVSGLYYLYAIHCAPEPISTSELPAATDSVDEQLFFNRELDCYIDALTVIGIAVRQAFAVDIVDCEFTLFYGDTRFTMRIIALGQRTLSSTLVADMQAFHRAVLCREACTPAVFSGRYMHLTALQNLRAQQQLFTALSPDEWAFSGNNELSIVFPVAGIDGKSFVFDENYVRQCADDAQTLIHNLNVLHHSPREPADIEPVEYSCLALQGDAVVNMFVVANNRSLQRVIPVTVEHRRSLADEFDVPNISKANHEIWNVQDRLHHISIDEKIKKDRLTYAQYFSRKSCFLEHRVKNYLEQSQPLQLIATRTMSTKDIHIPLLFPHNNRRVTSNHHCGIEQQSDSSRKYIYFMPEQCRPIGNARWFYLGRVLPSLLHRIRSSCLADEFRERVASIALQAKSKDQDIAPRCCFPHLSLTLQAITPPMAMESFDSECLEFLGDTVLKFVVTIAAYFHNPHANEQQLHDLRMRHISNSTLYKNAVTLKLAQYLRSFSLMVRNDCNDGTSNSDRGEATCKKGRGSKGNSSTNLPNALRIINRPPGLSLCPKERARNSFWNRNLLAQFNEAAVIAQYQAHDDLMHSEKAPQYGHAAISFKKVADMLEAAIGAYFLDGGIDAAITIINGIGLLPSANDSMIDISTIAGYGDILKKPPPPCSQDLIFREWMSALNGNAPCRKSFDERKLSETARVECREKFFSPSNFAEYALHMDKHSFCSTHFTTQQKQEAISSVSIGTHPKPLTSSDAVRIKVEHIVNYQFRNPHLLSVALKHRSSANNVFSVSSLLYQSINFGPLNSDAVTNERLEFLGDAVLDLLVVQRLFKKEVTPEMLTQAKAECTNNHRLSVSCVKCGLYQYLNCTTSVRRNMQLFATSIIADSMKEDEISNDDYETDSALMAGADGVAAEDNVATSQKRKRFHSSIDMVRDEGVMKSVRSSDVGASPSSSAFGESLQCDSGAVNPFQLPDYSAKDNNCKALADLIEALIGATFLDCDGDLDQLIRVADSLELLPSHGFFDR